MTTFRTYNFSFCFKCAHNRYDVRSFVNIKMVAKETNNHQQQAAEKQANPISFVPHKEEKVAHFRM